MAHPLFLPPTQRDDPDPETHPGPEPEAAERPDDPRPFDAAPRPFDDAHGRPDGDGADPPPSRWVDRVAELRHRLGLDVRLLAWGLAAVVAAGAAAWLLRPAPAPFEETLPQATADTVVAGTGEGSAPTAVTGPEAPTTSLLTEVVAYAAGAVVRPGVYRLDPTARVDDLVRAAGGLSPEADVGRINLAAPLADGARVYVPRIGEEEPPVVAGPDVPAAPVAGAGPDGAAPGAPINLNSATEEELDELPGVGPAIAASIVGYRTEHGGFSSVDELLEVRGIGEAKLADIRPLVVT